jgi:hypothetical protein
LLGPFKVGVLQSRSTAGAWRASVGMDSAAGGGAARRGFAYAESVCLCRKRWWARLSRSFPRTSLD